MNNRWRLSLVVLIMMLGGCSLVMSGKDVGEHIQIMQQHNPIGCGFFGGNGTPPASRIDAKFAGAWGEGMTVEDMNTCLDKLKELP